tara:strand:- start:3986 stop:4687 length:702 start_codon:yes stop_codon:yes gene_type:complete
MSKFFSIIPARIGSKGLPEKNLYILNNKPLIQWTLEASFKSKHISETIVSSDSDEILGLNKFFDFYPHKRNQELSNDLARTEDVILNIFNEINYLSDKYEYFVLLQPTSPLRTFEHINEACRKIIYTAADTLLSVKKAPREALKILIENDEGRLKPAFNDDFPFMPRQKLPNTFKPNGAIYIAKISTFIKNKTLLSENNSFVIMDEFSSIDIDTKEDILKANSIMKKNDKKNS